MNVQSVIREGIAWVHDILERTVADVPESLLHSNPDAATITSIASIYAHVVLGEDMLVQGFLQQKPPLFQAGGWATTTGVPPPAGPRMEPEWARSIRMSLPAFREFASAVYQATDNFVASLSEADIARTLQTGFAGQQTVAWLLQNIVIWHAATHAGEIAALKGMNGLRGLPV